MSWFSLWTPCLDSQSAPPRPVHAAEGGCRLWKDEYLLEIVRMQLW